MEQSQRGRRVAFFGGSFDPPHLGHLAVARAALRALDLDTVLFAPVGAQPLKPHGSTASFEDRVAMTRLAIANDTSFALSLADAPRPGGAPNYTLDTLLALRAEIPSGGALFCLMGADSFFGLHRWHRAAEIPFAAALIVASRPGQQLDGLRTALPSGLNIEAAPELTPDGHPFKDVVVEPYLLRNPQGETAPFYVLPGLEIGISASQVREMLQEGRDEPSGAHKGELQLLPASVADYIRSHGLYR